MKGDNTMDALSKTSFAFLCLTICIVANGAEIKDKKPLIPKGNSPQNFKKLSADAKADILCGVAEESYKILVKVPEKGLKDSRASLEKIISARKWLERTNDVVARTLALDLQYGIDSAIINEMYRKEKKKHSRPLRHKFKRGSYNNTLSKNLLKKNVIDENEYISYALSLDTEIAKFCKENNYDANDFLSCRVFREAADQMVISLWVTHNGEKIPAIENAYVWEANLVPVMAWAGFKTNSKREIAKFFLPKILRSIDEARDVRLLHDIYQEHGGFSESVEPKIRIFESDSFLGRLKAKVAKTKKPRLTLDKGNVSHSDQRDKLKAFLISGAMEGRVEVDDGDDREMSKYEAFLVREMMVFIKDPNVFSSDSFARIISRMGLLGLWLNVSD